MPAIGAYGYLKNLVTLAGGGLVVRGGAIIHRMGLGSWQRGREAIWSNALTALGVPIYLTIRNPPSAEPLDTHHLRKWHCAVDGAPLQAAVGANALDDGAATP